jgi:hypothetical protein
MEIYEYIDIFKKNTLYSNLLITDKSSQELIIARLLTGTVNFRNTITNEITKPQYSYSKLPFHKSSKNLKEISSFLNKGFKLSDFSDYLNYTRNRHQDYYRSIKIEITHCLYHSKNNDHVTAFIFSYRLLEAIAYGFPLIYASKSKNFQKTFNSLKKYFQGSEKDGELAFFNRFVGEMFSGSEFSSVNMDIDISAPKIDRKIQQIFYSELKKASRGCDIENDDEPNSFSIPFLQFHRFIINLRNLFFHNLTGGWHEKISSMETVEPNIFFSLVNDKIINWSAIVFFEIINFAIENNI